MVQFPNVMMLHYKLLLYNLLLGDLYALVIETYGVYLQTSVGLADTNDGSYRQWSPIEIVQWIFLPNDLQSYYIVLVYHQYALTFYMIVILNI
jgi:hypothetical protein